MKVNKTFYAVIGLVAAISIGCVFAFPIGSVARELAGVPLVGALVAALYQIIRDEAAHKKEISKQKDQQSFSLSISSHMASTAFDKHVAFCEKYRSAVIEGSKVLFRDGPAPSAIEVSWDLHDVRTEYGLWVTKDINEKLLEFEKAIRRIGIRSRRAERTHDDEKRGKIIDEVEELFDLITEVKEKNLEGEDLEEKRKDGIEDILAELQNILGIRELTSLRRKIINNANQALQTTSASLRV